MNTRSVERIIRQHMQSRGLAAYVIDDFISKWRRVASHEVAPFIDWCALRPMQENDVAHLSHKKNSELYRIGEENLKKSIVIKLNGGRSTTMGGETPKCMLPAKNNLSFLEITLRHIDALSQKYSIDLPLVLMNSFFTDAPTKQVTQQSNSTVKHFIQNEFPRLLQDTLMPLQTNKEEDWCPAGHGDFYRSFFHSGLLEDFLQQGYRYAFISNIDNLAAVLHPMVLGIFVSNDIDFMMEVTAKRAADVKGGSPVYVKEQASLLEIAQVAPDNINDFMDIQKFPYFNTNNLWFDLHALQALIETDRLALQVIVNKKTIANKNIIQIETAMGSALGCFDKTLVLEVARSRFLPVKRHEDLAYVQSDAVELDDNYCLISKEDNV